MRRSLMLMLPLAALALPGCFGLFGDDSADEQGTEGVAVPSFEEGERWSYAVATPERSFASETRFVGEQDADGVAYLVFEMTDEDEDGLPPPPKRSLIRKADLAVREIRQDYPRFIFEYDPPLNLLFPLSDHAYVGSMVVSSDLGAQRQDVVANVTVLGKERVEVPAGVFEAYHIVSILRVGEGSEQRTEVWFDPAVKLPVKTVASDRVEELSAYSAG